jgi:hypothetical protein
MPELTRGPYPMPFLPRHLSSFPLLFICQRYKTEFYQQCVRNCLSQAPSNKPTQGTGLHMCFIHKTSICTRRIHYGTIHIAATCFGHFIAIITVRNTWNTSNYYKIIDRDSPVGIATRHGLVGPGIESRWRQDFPLLFIPALGPRRPPVRCVPSLSQGGGGKAAGA